MLLIFYISIVQRSTTLFTSINQCTHCIIISPSLNIRKGTIVVVIVW